MVAGILPASDLPVDSSSAQIPGQRGGEEEVIKSHPFVGSPTLAFVVPKGPEWTFRLQLPEGVSPSLREELGEGLPALGLNQGITIERSRRIDVLWRWHHVVIAGEDHGYSGTHEGRGMGDQAIEPGEFVSELRSGLGIAIRKVEGCDQDPVHGCLDVASLAVVHVAGKGRSRQHRFLASRENSHSIPGTFALPDRPIPGSTEGLRREQAMLSPKFLEADDVGLRLLEPCQEVGEALGDVVDVESGDLQTYSGLTFGEGDQLIESGAPAVVKAHLLMF